MYFSYIEIQCLNHFFFSFITSFHLNSPLIYKTYKFCKKKKSSGAFVLLKYTFMNEHDLIIFSEILFSKEFGFEYKEKKQF